MAGKRVGAFSGFFPPVSATPKEFSDECCSQQSFLRTFHRFCATEAKKNREKHIFSKNNRKFATDSYALCVLFPIFVVKKEALCSSLAS